MIETGDIVLGQSGLRYVVADFFGAPGGGQMARLIRRTKTGTLASFARHEDGLTTFERPSFEPGDPVFVNELRGGYLGTENGRSRVLLAERRKPPSRQRVHRIGRRRGAPAALDARPRKQVVKRRTRCACQSISMRNSS